MMRRILTAALALLLAAMPLCAQKKAETRLYQKTVEQSSAEAFDRFLRKYPGSVYAGEIRARRDTLLNISPYDEAQAAEIAAAFLPAGTPVRAWAERQEGTDRICAVCLGGEGLAPDQVRILLLEKSGGAWTSENSWDLPAADAEGMAVRDFTDSTAVLTIRGVRYLRFNYLMRSEDGARQTYVAAAYAPQTDEFGCVSFRGSDIRSAGDAAPYRISGRTDEALLSGTERPWMRLMIKEIQDNPALEAIPDDIWLTDAAIAWWLEQNPGALTDATHLRFNILQPESSLVAEFAAAGGKKSSARYTAALFDHRGYTVIVVYQKASGDHVLAWVEPEAQDHYRDRLLNSISFDDANTLALSYYHGRRTFKYRLNLASKNLSRR